MTMQMLTIAQIAVMFICYLAVFVGLPAITFGVRLKRFSLSFRMMTYLIIGNFFVINLVLYLELLHLSNRLTLVLGTVIPYFCMWLRTHNISFVEWVQEQFLIFEKRTQGLMGSNTLRRNMVKQLWVYTKQGARWLFDIVVKHIVEWIVFAGVMALVWYLFGTNFITNFGYNASDIPVHNYWINGLSYNIPFIDGVYPMGYHVAIYYLHKVFRIDTYVLLRLWGLINIYGVVTMLMAFLACVCKRHPFLPFVGAVIYIAPNILQIGLWERFHSALPQEYGMVFILPPITYLFTFFEERAAELKAEREEKERRESEGNLYTSWAEIEAAPDYSGDDYYEDELGEADTAAEALAYGTPDTGYAAADAEPIMREAQYSSHYVPEGGKRERREERRVRLAAARRERQVARSQSRLEGAGRETREERRARKVRERSERRVAAAVARSTGERSIRRSASEERMRAQLAARRRDSDEERMREEILRRRGMAAPMQEWSEVADEYVEYYDYPEDAAEEVVLTTVEDLLGEAVQDAYAEDSTETTADTAADYNTDETAAAAVETMAMSESEMPEAEPEAQPDTQAIYDALAALSDEELIDRVLIAVIDEYHSDPVAGEITDATETAAEAEAPTPDEKRRLRIRERAMSLKASNIIDYIDSYIHTRTTSQWMLLLFAMALSLSVATHFYPAIIALILCVGAAFGYIGRIFRKQYFFSVMKAGILSFAFAVMPMAIALATGTPFQGSMGWALGVIGGTGSGGDAIIADSSDDNVIDDMEYRAAMEAMGFTLNEEGLVVDEYGEVIDGSYQGSVDVTQQHTPTFGEKVQKKVDDIMIQVRYLPTTLGFYLEEFLLNKDEDGEYVASGLPEAIYIVYAIVAVCGLLCLWKNREYGMQLLSIICGTAFITLLLASGSLSLPQLMDPARCRLFYYYMLAVVIVLAIDGVLTVVAGWVPIYAFQWVISIVAAGAVIYEVYALDLIREPIIMESMEYNGAIECTTNILAENDNYAFTILSANDELRMVEERGYHYETIRLLKHMVLYDTQDYSTDTISDITEAAPWDVYIPTKRIYIYIEKIPKDYFIHYEGSGQSVSEEGAKRPCPAYEATAVYMGEDRWICMSKMWYWALTYMKLHPDDMYVYYEDDDFICYCIEQNDYSLYNLSIDYGYNHCGEENLAQYYDDKS